MGTRWRGLLAPVDTPTGDGRRMADGAMRWRELPLGLKWQRTDVEGHDTSVIVGSADTINIGTVEKAIAADWISADAAARLNLDPTTVGVWGAGDLFDDAGPNMPRLAEDVAEAKLLLERGVIGPSVDAGAATMVLVRAGTDTPLNDDELDDLLWAALDGGAEPDLEMLFTDYEIAAATLVAVPAFGQCQPFELIPAAQPSPALVAAVIGSTDLPVADYDTAWDAAAAAGRVFDAHTAADGTVDVAAVSQAFLWRDDQADDQTQAAYKLGVADIIDGLMRIVPAAVQACAGRRGVDAADVPDPDRAALHSKVCALYSVCRAADEQMPDCPFDSAAGDGQPVAAEPTAAAVSSLTAAAVGVPADVFTPPTFTEYTDISWSRRPDGLVAVAGHFAPDGACHLGFRDMCRTPPETVLDYAPFHRYPVQLADGSLTAAGRITTGFGKVGTGCVCCRGKGDHACDGLDLAAAITHHDKLTCLAYVRAGRDEFGQYVVGYAVPGLSDAGLTVLGRGKFSGDWRDYGGNLELIELVGLTTAQPAFPAPHIRTHAGRRLALTAAFTPPKNRTRAGDGTVPAGYLAERVAAALRPLLLDLGAGIRRLTPPVPAPPAPARSAALVAAAHTGAMVALIPAATDAADLAVDGGEPADELHLTLAYLGEAADIAEDVQMAVVDGLRRYVSTLQDAAAAYTVVGRSFAVDVFNPADDDTETAIVLGVAGDQLAPIHAGVIDALHATPGLVLPEQHAPWVAHVTLIYSDDLGLVATLTDRTGRDIVFDRLRVAFAGVNTDLSLSAVATPPDPTTEAARLAAEVDAAINAVLAEDRAAEAAALWTELEASCV